MSGVSTIKHVRMDPYSTKVAAHDQERFSRTRCGPVADDSHKFKEALLKKNQKHLVAFMKL